MRLHRERETVEDALEGHVTHYLKMFEFGFRLPLHPFCPRVTSRGEPRIKKIKGKWSYAFRDLLVMDRNEQSFFNGPLNFGNLG